MHISFSVPIAIIIIVVFIFRSFIRTKLTQPIVSLEKRLPL